MGRQSVGGTTSGARGALALGLCASVLAIGFALAGGAAHAEPQVVEPPQVEPPLTEPPVVEREAYDPLEGMDEDGRIPRVDKGALVDRPERWRYLPESRIPPGNVFDRFLVSSVIFPILFFNSDVGAGFGAGVTDIDFRKQRRREFLGLFGSYSTEGQQSYSVTWRRWLKHLEVPTGGVLQEERSFVRVAAGYRKTLTRRFFGIGPATNERDETSYTDKMIWVDAGLATSLEGALEDVVVSISLVGEQHWLSDGRVGGAFNTDESPIPRTAALFQDADQTTLGWLNAGIAWDTRDSVRNPYEGWAIGANVRAALLQADRTVGAIYTIHADQVFKLPPLFHDGGDPDEEHPPTDSIGFHFRTQLSSGDLPFFARPTLGGSDIARGFIAGRWRDDALWAAAAEYRFWVIPRGFTLVENIRVERIGGALFYEAGGVGEDGLALFDSGVIHTYGFGARATVERAVLFRLDLGFSEEGMNFAAGFGLSF